MSEPEAHTTLSGIFCRASFSLAALTERGIKHRLGQLLEHCVSAVVSLGWFVIYCSSPLIIFFEAEPHGFSVRMEAFRVGQGLDRTGRAIEGMGGILNEARMLHEGFHA